MTSRAPVASRLMALPVAGEERDMSRPIERVQLNVTVIAARSLVGARRTPSRGLANDAMEGIRLIGDMCRADIHLSADRSRREDGHRNDRRYPPAHGHASNLGLVSALF